MNRQDYSFQFTFFSSKTQMFDYGDIGIVIEKERDVVCIYGTSPAHNNIYCAVPLCHPKFLKGATYLISLFSDNKAIVKVADIIVYIDFDEHKCANNKGIRCYGSDEWGRDIEMPWDNSLVR